MVFLSFDIHAVFQAVSSSPGLACYFLPEAPTRSGASFSAEKVVFRARGIAVHCCIQYLYKLTVHPKRGRLEGKGRTGDAEFCEGACLGPGLLPNPVSEASQNYPRLLLLLLESTGARFPVILCRVQTQSW